MCPLYTACYGHVGLRRTLVCVYKLMADHRLSESCDPFEGVLWPKAVADRGRRAPIT